MDLGAWLRDLGLQQYEQSFRDQDITLDLLKSLSGDDLRELGVASLGHRKRLLLAAAALPNCRARGIRLTSRSLWLPRQSGAANDRFRGFGWLDGAQPGLDPEELREAFRSYQNAVAGRLFDLRDIAKFMGDGVIAYFGWPKAHEDEVERRSGPAWLWLKWFQSFRTPAARPLNVRLGSRPGLSSSETCWGKVWPARRL